MTGVQTCALPIFKKPFSGIIAVKSSLDGRNIEQTAETKMLYTNRTVSSLYLNQIGKWHVVDIKGYFDLTYLEFIGLRAGRR